MIPPPPPAAADKRAISRVRLSPEKNGVKLPKAWQSLFVAVGGAAWGLSLRHKRKRRKWRAAFFILAQSPEMAGIHFHCKSIKYITIAFQ
jgi:hypothetical protein